MASGTLRSKNDIIYDDYTYNFTVTANIKGYQQKTLTVHDGYKVIGATIMEQNYLATLAVPSVYMSGTTNIISCNYYSYSSGTEKVVIRVAWAKI